MAVLGFRLVVHLPMAASLSFRYFSATHHRLDTRRQVMISCDILGRFSVCSFLSVYSVLSDHPLCEWTLASAVKRDKGASKSMTQDAVYGMRKASCRL